MKRKIFLILLGLIIVGVYSKNETELSVPNSSIRLRVIPNSNDTKDINIKEQVKDYLETDIYTLLKNIDNIDSARTIINTSIPKIETNIDNIFKDNNYNIPYKINFGNNSTKRSTNTITKISFVRKSLNGNPFFSYSDVYMILTPLSIHVLFIITLDIKKVKEFMSSLTLFQLLFVLH